MSQGEHDASTVTNELEDAMLGINDNHFGSDDEERPPCNDGKMVTSSSSDPEFIVLDNEADPSFKITGSTRPPESLLEPSGLSEKCTSCCESGSNPSRLPVDSAENFPVTRMEEVQSEIKDLLKDIRDSFQRAVVALQVIADALQRE